MPIGEGNDGKVYAVALSPDGKWVAAGGWDAYALQRQEVGIYIFEAATGRLVTRLGRLGNVIYHLAFSPDGSRLAATLGGGEGMRLWETAGWRLLAEDKDYGGKDSYGAAFDSANRLYTVAYDGQIRRYGADGRLEAKATTQGGKEPYSIAVHPQGGKLAIGFNDTTAVEVYDARTLKRLYAAGTSGIERRQYRQRRLVRRWRAALCGRHVQQRRGVSLFSSGRTKAGASAVKRRCRKTPSCSFCLVAMASRRGQPIPPSA